MNYKGKQSGYYWTTPLKDGIYIEITDGGFGVNFKRIRGGEIDSRFSIAILKDVYDENNGCMVAGVALTDATGEPTGEVYKMRDFQITGNITENTNY
ncbi:hypothetical protein D3C74_50070 [compost metagenome]